MYKIPNCVFVNLIVNKENIAKIRLLSKKYRDLVDKKWKRINFVKYCYDFSLVENLITADNAADICEECIKNYDSPCDYSRTYLFALDLLPPKSFKKIISELLTAGDLEMIKLFIGQHGHELKFFYDCMSKCDNLSVFIYLYDIIGPNQYDLRMAVSNDCGNIELFNYLLGRIDDDDKIMIDLFDYMLNENDSGIEMIKYMYKKYYDKLSIIYKIEMYHFAQDTCPYLLDWLDKCKN